MLIRVFNWSLYDIDRTDSESLFDFVKRFNETRGGEFGTEEGTQQVYCDQVSL